MAEQSGRRTPPVRIAAGAVGVSVLAAASMGTWQAGPAAADVGGVTLQYTCSLPPFPDLAMTARIRWTAPNTVLVGHNTPAVPVSATAIVGASFAQAAAVIGAATVEGGASAHVAVHAPEGEIDLPLPLTVPRTKIPASGLTNIPATGSSPVVVFHQPGSATVRIGSQLALNLTPRDANGQLTAVGQLIASCTLNPGQDTALFSIDIRTPVAPAPTSGGATRPTASPSGRPTSAEPHPGTTPGPGPGGSGTTRPTATDTARPTTAGDTPDSTSAATGTPDPTSITSPLPETTSAATSATTSASTAVPDAAVRRAAESTSGRGLLLGVILAAVAGAAGSGWWLMRRRRRVT